MRTLLGSEGHIEHQQFSPYLLEHVLHSLEVRMVFEFDELFSLVILNPNMILNCVVDVQ